MDFWTITLATLACYSLYYYFTKNLNYFKDLGIPYLPGWPIFGNMGGPILRRKHISEVVQEIYNVNPDAKYVGAFNFVQPVFVLRDLELIKSIAIKNFDNFPDHKSFMDDTMDPLFGAALFNIRGDRWRETRNLLSPAFTSSKMKAMYELVVDCAKNFINHINDLPDDAKKMIDTKDLFTKLTNDVIATCAFGISVDSLKNPNNDFYTYGKEVTNLDGLQTAKLFLARAFPELIKMLKIKFVSDRIAKFFTNIVSTTVATRDEKGITRPDMLQLMMDARGNDTNNLTLNMSEMTAQAFLFFFAGFDTTSTQMCVLAHELAINSETQRKLQDEIDSVMRKTDGKPSYDAIISMQYLDAVFKEALRRHTQASFLDRLCTRTFELPPALPGGKPITIQPGAYIWIPASAIHTDPKYHENPEKFDPERYYQKKLSNTYDVSNMGFGIGPRSCIGNRFALMETKVLFFFLLQKFNLKPNSKTSVPLKYSKKTFTLAADGGFWLTVEPRK